MTEMSKTDRRLVAAALEKHRTGGKPSAAEKRALKGFRKAEEERLRWEYYKSIPKKDYLKLSNRHGKVVLDQGRRYGLPLEGRTLDLGKVLTAFHDLLARNKHLLAAGAEDPLLAGASQSLKDAYVREQIREKASKARLAELDVAGREKRTIYLEPAHEFFGVIAARLRQCGEQLQKLHGPDAHRLLDEALDDIDAQLDPFFEAYAERKE